MISVSDILKILDKIPVWKTLKGLPARLEALEQRVAELEGKPTEPDYLHTCAECSAPAKVSKIVDHPQFGVFGHKLRTITCKNGHSYDYKWVPGEE